MRFQRLHHRAPPNDQGHLFRLHRVDAGLYIFEVARELRIRLRDLHDFEDGRVVVRDGDDLVRLYEAIGRRPPQAGDPVPHITRPPIPHGYPDIRRRPKPKPKPVAVEPPRLKTGRTA